MGTDGVALRYAGFWPRLAAILLDGLIWLALSGPMYLIGGRYRMFWILSSITGYVMVVIYEIYLVRRFGGTPGKLLMGLRIRKSDGNAVGYREAILRWIVNAFFSAISTYTLVCAIWAIPGSEFRAASVFSSWKRIGELGQHPSLWMDILFWAWFLANIVVFFANSKRRALHDYIAGTIVVHLRAKESPQQAQTAGVEAVDG